MKAFLTCVLGASLAAIGFGGPAFAQDLPPEAQQIISAARQDVEAIQRRAQEEQKRRESSLAKQLAELSKALRAEGRNAAAAQVEKYVAGQDAPPAASNKCEVEWRGTWYPAVVLKREGNRFYIKYDGYGDESNEWVGPERIRGLEIKQPKEVARAAPVVGAAIEILWGGTWWPGKLIKTENNRYYISYDNYDPEWNEWVGPERIKGLEGKEAKPAGHQVGAAVEILWGGKWWPGKILKSENGQYQISYDNWGPEWNEVVPPDRIRPSKEAAGANRFPPGTNVDVEWHGTWYPSKVLKAEEGRWFIKYDRDTDAWNEWVGPTRIRARDEPTARTAYTAGAKVDIEWHGSWWPGEITKVEGTRFFIHYDNHDNTWDEWVGADRLRARSTKATSFPYPKIGGYDDRLGPYSPDGNGNRYSNFIPAGK